MIRFLPRPRTAPVRRGTALIACAAALVFAGCQKPEEPARPKVPSAQSDVELNTRVIEFRNRLQTDPYSADARFGLGQALLDQADVRGAEAELARALELGMDPNVVLPVLARTWNSLGRSKDLIRDHAATRLTVPRASAELKAALSVAYANTGDAANARAMAEAALKDDPGSVFAQLLQAQVALADGKVDDATKLVEAAISAHPESIDALELKGDIQAMVGQDAKAAAQTYGRALEIAPRSVTIRAKLITLALSIPDIAEAERQLAALAKVAPTSLPHRYFEARVHFAKGQLEPAREAIKVALTEYPRDLRSLILSGQIDLRSGALRSAEESLATALTLAPRVPRTRLLLAQTYLRLGTPDKAQVVLEPLLRAARPSGEALGLAAEAALQADLPVVAARLFERAAAADPDNPRFKAAVAVTRIARGEVQEGFAELEAAAATDPTPYADMALVSARLRSGDLPAALRAAERVAAKQPDRPMTHWLLGQLERRAGRNDVARKHLERAAALDKAYVPAALALAELDLAAGAPEAAKKRFEAVLAQSPGNLDAQLAMIGIRERAGDPSADIVVALEALTRQHAGKLRPQLALIDHLIRAGNGAAALVAAQRAAGDSPEDLVVLDALGRAQVAAGETAQALTTFRKIVTARPRAPEPHIAMARVYIARNEIDSAIDSLREAVRLNPRLVAPQVSLVDLMTRKKNWPEALKLARNIQTRFATDARGFHLEGLVHMAQRQWEPAQVAFRSALQREDSSETALQLHTALRGAGRNDEAARFAEQWLAKRPKDNYFIGYLGETEMLAGNFKAAEARFRAVLKTDPGSADAMNNLAWVLLQQARPQEAVEWSRKAVEASPMRAAYQDTLSMALAADGKLAEAVANQKKVVQMAPDMPVLQLHLAQLAIQTGDFTLARAHLDKLSAMGKDFPGQAEVWKLRQQLR